MVIFLMINKKIIKMHKIIIALLFSCIMIIGCDNSQSDRKDIERKKMKIERELAKKEKEIDLEKRYGATYFPKENIIISGFTYDVQKYFDDHKNSIFVFECRFVDAQLEGDYALLEFVCPIGYDAEITLRLRSTKDMADELIEDHKKKMNRDNRVAYEDKGYVVVAKIMKLGKVSFYKASGDLDGEDIVIEHDVTNSLYANGILVKAIYNNKK